MRQLAIRDAPVVFFISVSNRAATPTRWRVTTSAALFVRTAGTTCSPPKATRLPTKLDLDRPLSPASPRPTARVPR